MQAALALHDRLIRAAIESRSGYVFKTVGDFFCTAFARAGRARGGDPRLARSPPPAWSMLSDAGPLRARMGCLQGERTRRGGDYFGPPVNRVARLEAAGHGGQILVSSVMRAAVAGIELPAGPFRDLGEHRLKTFYPRSGSPRRWWLTGWRTSSRARTAPAPSNVDRIVVIVQQTGVEGEGTATPRWCWNGRSTRPWRRWSPSFEIGRKRCSRRSSSSPRRATSPRTGASGASAARPVVLALPVGQTLYRPHAAH
ncbi:MAG: adenylate/guanylate cyclase domain-containing protein [Anaerolineae bacterium]